jgi:hypothetical protein
MTTPARVGLDAGLMRSAIPIPISHTQPEMKVNGPRSGPPAMVRTTSTPSKVATARVSHATRAATRVSVGTVPTVPALHFPRGEALQQISVSSS